MNTSPTVPQLEAELERARQEVDALRDLLAAVAETALPLPAEGCDFGDWDLRCRDAARRLEFVTAWAKVSDDSYASRAVAEVIRDHAAQIRKECAYPLRYTPEDAR